MGRLSRKLLMFGGAAAIGSAGFAYMATNNVPATNAGVGANVVSGYTVQTVHYYTEVQPAVTGGDYVQGLVFKLAPNNAKEVTAWFANSSGQQDSGFYQCNQLTADDPSIDTMFGLQNTDGFWSCGSSPYGGQVTTVGGVSWVPTIKATQLHVAASQ